MANRLAYQHDTLDEQPESCMGDEWLVRHGSQQGNLRLVGIAREGQTIEGNLISSATDRVGIHMPVLDLDVPHRLVPSSTPGHSHLYIDVEVPEKQYRRLVEVLIECGILQRGVGAQMRVNGATYVRPPHVRKPQPPEPPAWPKGHWYHEVVAF
jgi:hypothetical protein